LNVLTLFYAHGRGRELSRTLHRVHEVLLHRAYLEGTCYYVTAECFLFFASRLLDSSNDEDLHSLLKPLLKERVQERIGAAGDALALAMRILTCSSVGIRDEVDLRALLPLQYVFTRHSFFDEEIKIQNRSEDGGWEIGWICKYSSSGIKIGNRGLTTAYAINAIEAVNRSPTASLFSSSITTSPPNEIPSTSRVPRFPALQSKTNYYPPKATLLYVHLALVTLAAFVYLYEIPVALAWRSLLKHSFDYLQI
jgi:hypothetical protein